jgi:DNA topoisomerase-1
VVEREVVIRGFVPAPYWTIVALAQTQTAQLRLKYAEAKVDQRARAFAVQSECEGQEGVVTEFKRQVSSESPPPPFNLGGLQHEAHRVFGFAPSVTAALAERLYLDALISYPRTDSQKLPASINYPAILLNLGRLPQYSSEAEELRRGPLRPREGPKTDPAHPAIYPTGELPVRPPERDAAKLYDLIVRRFFAIFGADALYERGAAEVSVGTNRFFARGRRVMRVGWMRYYRPYVTVDEAALPPLAVGERVRLLRVDVTEHVAQPPLRYEAATLLAQMEGDNIGTKATRAEIIRTLYTRGYVVGQQMVATELALAVVETMAQHTPAIISPSLTRQMEAELDRIAESGEGSEAVIERAMDQVMRSIGSIRSAELSVGGQISTAARAVAVAQSHLGQCPVCRQGQLHMIRSRQTGKRFVGCSRYAEGCRASAPLPQRGTIRPTARACQTCRWPVVSVRLGRFPWRLCINPECPTKRGRRRPGAQHVPVPVAASGGALP